MATSERQLPYQDQTLEKLRKWPVNLSIMKSQRFTRVLF